MNMRQIAVLDCALISFGQEERGRYTIESRFKDRMAVISVMEAERPILTLAAGAAADDVAFTPMGRKGEMARETLAEHIAYWNGRMDEMAEPDEPMRPEYISLAVALTTVSPRRRRSVAHCMRTATSMTLGRLANACAKNLKGLDDLMAEAIRRKEREDAWKPSI
jgi:hypothetical protein